MSGPALLAAIEGESAAIYAYGLAGPRVPLGDSERARGGLAAHRVRLGLLRARVPAAEQPAGPGGFAIEAPADGRSARRLLGEVEMRLAGVYADLAAEDSGDLRVEAVAASAECAVRAIGWGVPPQAFPGHTP
jgi:hypothetical protein